MVRVGIAGLGFMSVAHIKGYRQLDDVEIVAVCSPSGRRLDGDLSDVVGNVGDQNPVQLDMNRVTGYRDWDAFLKHPDLDVVDICTPTRTHHSLAIAALQAGHHVICEKPLARTVTEAEEIAAVAKGAKGFFMPAMCLRFWPEWAWLKQVIDDQRYGRLLGLNLRRIAEAPGWGQTSYFDGENSGGALFDLHVHDTDYICHCFGRPLGVFSTGFSKVSGAIDHVMTQYQVASGACVSAEGSWAMAPGFGFNMSYTAVFESATVVYDLAQGDRALMLYREGAEPEVVQCDGLDGYAGELGYLADCVRKGRAPARVTVEDALMVTEVCAAEEESVRIGQRVALD